MAQFLLTGFLIFCGFGALSASENEVLEVSEITVHQAEVDRVLSISILDNVSVLDQDDFFVLDSKTVVGTKTHRTNSIRKKVLSFELQDFVVTFHDPHSNSNFQNSNSNLGPDFLPFLIVSQDFSSRTQKLALIKINLAWVLSSLENFEVLKMKNDSILSRELTSDMISLLVLFLSFPNSFGSGSYLSDFLDNHFQQIEWVINLKERIGQIPISRFAQSWKEAYPIPNSVRRSELRSALTKEFETGIIPVLVGTVGKNQEKEILSVLWNLLNPGKTTTDRIFIWLRNLESKSILLKTMEIVEIIQPKDIVPLNKGFFWNRSSTNGNGRNSKVVLSV
ncbi:hypothetical protein [Leptospira weilii]|uniref:hypothetical protein n=1 Tax=Leptospira weilii TaxID=28184 RepID=UPI0018AD2F41|nr:hypothetical protein [Leptospira weilii]